jgi:predicted transposase YbfD/YdcC
MKTNEKIEKLNIENLKRLKEKAKTLKDTRQQGKVTYKIWDIVVVTILAVLSDCNEWDEIEDFAKSKISFLKKFLKLTGGIPTAITYERVIGILDSSILNSIFIEFVSKIKYEKSYEFKDILSFDGKVDNGSSRKESMHHKKIKGLNVLNVYSDSYGMSIMQEMIEDKTNEITVIPKLIEQLDLKDVICTWDALNTQKDNVKAVVDKHGDYVVALKGNQENFYEDVKDYLDQERLDIIKSGYEGSYLLEREKSHGAVITYEYYQTEKVKWYEEHEKWAKLRSIGVVVKTTDRGKKKVIESRYYISSLLLNIRMFSLAIRKHWNVENKLHWQLDFTFKCDSNTTINKNALFNLQLIKKFCLKLLSEAQKEYKKSLKRIRKDIARNVEDEIVKVFKVVCNFDTSSIM